MAPVNPMGKFSQMTTKQKAMTGVIIVVVLFMGWMVIDLFSSGPKPIPKPVVAQIQPAARAMTATKPMANSPVANNIVAAANPTPTLPVNAAPAQTSGEIKEAPVPGEETNVKADQKYVDALNKLQMLKLEQLTTQTNEAIATSKLATVTAEKAISDLLTKPAPAPVPVSSYGNALIHPAYSGANMPPSMEGLGNEGTHHVTNNAPPPTIEVPYVVISVSMKLNRWNAVIGLEGKLYSVSIGDTLPDGSSVNSISQDSVVISKEGKKRKITMLTSI